VPASLTSAKTTTTSSLENPTKEMTAAAAASNSNTNQVPSDGTRVENKFTNSDHHEGAILNERLLASNQERSLHI